jgi:NDP-sugar pyrophosphorylase family protein
MLINSMLHPSDFFDLQEELSSSLFAGCDYVWQAIAHIKTHVVRLVGNSQLIEGEVASGAYLGSAPLYIGPGARIEPGAYIEGPAYIGAGAVVRHGAYVRENVIMLPGSMLGHASEAKNSILLNGAHAPHFNYVGDSILGQGVNLGAGTKLSNLGMLSAKDGVTGKRPTIYIDVEGVRFDTGLTKMGAVLGDGAQTGCNSVLNPGCLIAPRTLIYANVSVRKGYYPPDSLLKLRQQTDIAPRRSTP